MPKAYTNMRDKFASQGMSMPAAKEKAAKIYNANNPGAPVTRGYDAAHPPKRGKGKGLQAMVKRSKSRG